MKDHSVSLSIRSVQVIQRSAMRFHPAIGKALPNWTICCGATPSSLLGIMLGSLYFPYGCISSGASVADSDSYQARQACMTAPDSEAYTCEDECVAAPRLLIRDEHIQEHHPVLSHKPCSVTGEFSRAASSNTATSRDSSSNAVSRIFERTCNFNHTRSTDISTMLLVPLASSEMLRAPNPSSRIN
jgi:hypothetical protein